MASVPVAMSVAVPAVRLLAIIVGLGIWFWTQRLLSRRTSTGQIAGDHGPIWDGIHHVTAKINRHLNAHPGHANALLIASSLVIDVLGIYLLGSAILGPTIGPFLGLLMLFALRQICQMFCPLPLPPGMIWRHPGFPTMLVTYGTADDLFFSGHTAMAVYGAVTLAAAFGPLGMAVGGAIIVFQIVVVLILRAHYTMDVFTGMITALYVHHLAVKFAPTVDQWIGLAVSSVGR